MLGELCKDDLEIHHELKDPYTPFRSSNPNVTVRKKPVGRRRKELARSLGDDDFSFTPSATTTGHSDQILVSVDVSDTFEPLRAIQVAFGVN